MVSALAAAIAFGSLILTPSDLAFDLCHETYVVSIALKEARYASFGASTFVSQSSRAISRAVARLPIVDCRRRIPACCWATAS